MISNRRKTQLATAAAMKAAVSYQLSIQLHILMLGEGK